MRRVRVRDEVLGAGEEAVEAYVVEPADGEIRAGILFLHWLGEHRSDRTQFLSEAKQWARRGVRCVLPAGRLPWGPDPVDAETDIANLEILKGDTQNDVSGCIKAHWCCPVPNTDTKGSRLSIATVQHSSQEMPDTAPAPASRRQSGGTASAPSKIPQVIGAAK